MPGIVRHRACKNYKHRLGPRLSQPSQSLPSSASGVTLRKL